MSLAVVCPSRERPDLCARMAESMLKASAVDLLIYVDDDDSTRERYEPLIGDRTIVHFGPPIGRGAAVNFLCESTDYTRYLVVSDDITFDRAGWAEQVESAMDAFGDDIGCVHLASDNPEHYVNWACVSRKWIDTLGWFNYPLCRWFCQDTIIQALAEGLDRLTFIEPRALTHHIVNHPNVANRFATDTVQFLWYMAKQYGTDLKKLREAM